jgi:hypothetical protein
MTSKGLTLRLPPEVEGLLARAHGRIGRALPRHRLALVALARGLGEIIEDPSRLFEALPSVEGSPTDAPPTVARVPPPPTTPDAKRPPPEARPSKATKGAEEATDGHNRTEPDASAVALATRKRVQRGAPSEEELARLAVDIDAHTKAEEARGNRRAVMELVERAGITGRSHLYGFLRDRREGTPATMGAAMFKALRAALDATPEGAST